MLQPKIITTLKNYNRKQFTADLIAGIIVGIVALPLAIALGIASGVSPQSGLITAVVAGFIISLLGGSRVQIGGPTGAFIVVLYGIVEKFGIDGLLVATFMAGVMLVLMGLFKLGSIIKFMPYPVIVGFTSGIAVVIFSSQVKDFLGFPIDKVPADFFDKWILYAQHIGSINWYAFGMAVVSVLLIVYFPRINRTIPGSLVAILFTTIATLIWHIPVETIGSRFGQISGEHPAFRRVPHVAARADVAGAGRRSHGLGPRPGARRARVPRGARRGGVRRAREDARDRVGRHALRGGRGVRQMKGILHCLAQQAPEPKEFMVRSNQALRYCLERGSFISATYFVLDRQARKIFYARAGHCPVLFFKASTGKASFLTDKGAALGMVRSKDYCHYVENNEIAYEPGDVMVLFTDGITEAKNPRGEESGLDRLKETIEEVVSKSPREMQEYLINELYKYTGTEEINDDYTTMIVKFRNA